MMSLSIRFAHRAFCIVVLTGALCAHAYAQSGPPADSCDANPATCVPPQFSIDECASFKTAPDMWIAARADGSWDPDYLPFAFGNQQPEFKQLLFASGSGYYGYRPCKGFVVQLVVDPRSHIHDPDGLDSVAWNAGAWDLPSSGQNDQTFPPLMRGVLNQPQVGYGDANVNDLPSGSHSVPTNANDCTRYHEHVVIYSATVPNLPFPFPGFLHWTQIYNRRQVGSWQGGTCSLKCEFSFPQPGCAAQPPFTITFPDADQNEPPIAYRFVIGTLLRTSWQQTGLVLWEGAGQPPG